MKKEDNGYRLYYVETEFFTHKPILFDENNQISFGVGTVNSGSHVLFPGLLGAARAAVKATQHNQVFLLSENAHGKPILKKVYEVPTAELHERSKEHLIALLKWICESGDRSGNPYCKEPVKNALKHLHALNGQVVREGDQDWMDALQYASKSDT